MRRVVQKDFQVSKIILVIIDALRYDFLNSRVMPFTSEFACKGLFFKNAYSTTNATDPSLTSIYTGMYPLNHGLINHGERVTVEEIKELNYTRFLQELLQSRGWDTLAIDYLDRWHRRGFQFYGYPGELKLSFIRFIPWNLRVLIPKIISRIKGIRTKYSKPYNSNDAINYLIKLLHRYGNLKSRRMFILVHLWDTHIPYTASDRIIEKFADEYRGGIYDMSLRELIQGIKGPWKDTLLSFFDIEMRVGDIVAMYAAAAWYADRAIQKLVEFLWENDLMDNTMLIITSDHGESLYEHNILFDHHGLYEVSIKVPLIIYLSGMEGKVVESLVQHIDLFPTILSMVGMRDLLERISRELDGIDLLNILTGSESRSFIYAEESYTQRKFAIRIGRYKYITSLGESSVVCRYCNVVHGGDEELYDLTKDSHELINIIDSHRDLAKEFRNLLQDIVKALVRKRIKRKIVSKLNSAIQ